MNDCINDIYENDWRKDFKQVSKIWLQLTAGENKVKEAI